MSSSGRPNIEALKVNFRRNEPDSGRQLDEALQDRLAQRRRDLEAAMRGVEKKAMSSKTVVDEGQLITEANQLSMFDSTLGFMTRLDRRGLLGESLTSLYQAQRARMVGQQQELEIATAMFRGAQSEEWLVKKASALLELGRFSEAENLLPQEWESPAISELWIRAAVMRGRLAWALLHSEFAANRAEPLMRDRILARARRIAQDELQDPEAVVRLLKNKVIALGESPRELFDYLIQQNRSYELREVLNEIQSPPMKRFAYVERIQALASAAADTPHAVGDATVDQALREAIAFGLSPTDVVLSVVPIVQSERRKAELWLTAAQTARNVYYEDVSRLGAFVDADNPARLELRASLLLLNSNAVDANEGAKVFFSAAREVAHGSDADRAYLNVLVERLLSPQDQTFSDVRTVGVVGSFAASQLMSTDLLRRSSALLNDPGLAEQLVGMAERDEWEKLSRVDMVLGTQQFDDVRGIFGDEGPETPGLGPSSPGPVDPLISPSDGGAAAVPELHGEDQVGPQVPDQRRLGGRPEADGEVENQPEQRVVIPPDGAYIEYRCGVVHTAAGHLTSLIGELERNNFDIRAVREGLDASALVRARNEAELASRAIAVQSALDGLNEVLTTDNNQAALRQAGAVPELQRAASSFHDVFRTLFGTLGSDDLRSDDAMRSNWETSEMLDLVASTRESTMRDVRLSETVLHEGFSAAQVTAEAVPEQFQHLVESSGEPPSRLEMSLDAAGGGHQLVDYGWAVRDVAAGMPGSTDNPLTFDAALNSEGRALVAANLGEFNLARRFAGNSVSQMHGAKQGWDAERAQGIAQLDQRVVGKVVETAEGRNLGSHIGVAEAPIRANESIGSAEGAISNGLTSPGDVVGSNNDMSLGGLTSRDLLTGMTDRGVGHESNGGLR